MPDLNETVSKASQEFLLNFMQHGDIGAALSVWMGATEICSKEGGFIDEERAGHWKKNTMVTINSAINGPVAATVLTALYNAGLSPDTLIGDIWPELGNGKLAQFPLRILLSHQAGLPFIENFQGSGHDDAVAALNQQSPVWEPGTAHGYHVGTFSIIADEIVRRLELVPLPDFWRSQIADILGLNIWIGETRPAKGSVANALHVHGPIDPGSFAALESFERKDSLTYRAYQFSNCGISESAPCPEFPLPRVSGIASAASLARFYSLMASGGDRAGFQVFPSAVCDWAGELVVEGFDQVLKTTTAFSVGFMKDPVDYHSGKIHLFSSSPGAFGYPGEGGSFAFGDPGTQLGFAYVANEMDRSLLPSEKALRLSRPFYEF